MVIWLTGCAGRPTPAPVVDVQGSKPLNQRVKNSIKSTEYIVKKGETLYSIAWRSDLDVRTLATANKISSPYKIYPGQKLFLVNNSLTKNVKASNGKSYTKKLSKSSEAHKIHRIKKPVAQKKKQEYGKNVRPKKTSVNKKLRNWQWPSDGKIIALFSTAEQGNKGIDIAGKRGNKIKSAADGKVVYAGSALRGYGKLVIVKHNEDYLSAYAHNDVILVKEQHRVNAGDVIAKMGNTGAQRTMLHFEVRFRGKSVNPLKYLPKK
jgi:lipoprotein NlpD